MHLTHICLPNNDSLPLSSVYSPEVTELITRILVNFFKNIKMKRLF